MFVHVVHRDYFFPNSFSVVCLAPVIQILTVKIYETKVAEDNTYTHLDFCFMSSVHKTTFIFPSDKQIAKHSKQRTRQQQDVSMAAYIQAIASSHFAWTEETQAH